MRSMQLAHPRPISDHPLQRVETAEPRPGSGELVLRIGACAVCRTDLQLCEGDLAMRRRPVTPGHQIIGRVVAVGANAPDWSEGDRAGVGWLAGACGRCARCTEGRENL